MRGVSCIDNLYSLAIPSLEKPCTAVQVSEASELSLSLDLTLKEHGEGCAGLVKYRLRLSQQQVIRL